MPRFYLRFVLIPLMLFSAMLLLIHAQPYDDHGLHELLLPEGCASPCFMGIRPGVTTIDEAIKLLKASGWVDSIANPILDNLPVEEINWNWNNQKPKMITQESKMIYHDVQGQLWTQNNVVIGIIFHTSYSLGDTRIVFGSPSGEGSGIGSIDVVINKVPVIYNAYYKQIGLTITTSDYCKTSKPRFLQQEVTLLLSVPTGLEPTQSGSLNTIAYACRT